MLQEYDTRPRPPLRLGVAGGRGCRVCAFMSLPGFLQKSNRHAAAGGFGAGIFRVPERRAWLVVGLHLAALAVMISSEVDWIDRLAFVLVWVILNCFWLTLLRRAGIAAVMSLSIVALLIVLSRLKHEIVFMTANFLDVLIIDPDTYSFLLTMFPNLGKIILAGCVVAVPIMVWIWRNDQMRMARWRAAATGTVCMGALVTLAASNPDDPWHLFRDGSHVSKFARSGVETLSDLWSRGWLEAEAAVSDRIATAPPPQCRLAKRPPHIILVHDESSFDARAIDGVKWPPGDAEHFRAGDGKQRQFMVDSHGGASWFAEYNVLTGLSSRSFGRFAYFLTRVAAGHIDRGLPRALQNCDYRTFSLYPAHGAFMSARQFHKTTGIEYFFDAKALGTKQIQPDTFYFNAAADMIAKERRRSPMFMFVYLAANHYPWTNTWRPDLTPAWRDLGNSPKVEEYLRRQTMSARDYAAFTARLKKDFPDESFLILRYGDHQPEFAAEMLEAGANEELIGKRMEAFDPRYFTTYYAIDAINYTPPSAALMPPILDAPYVPLVIQELAGLPLDATFVEQKKIFERCEGIFYACHGGAEARRFNRMLIDAGHIKGL